MKEDREAEPHKHLNIRAGAIPRQHPSDSLWEGDGNLYWSLGEPIQVITPTSIRLLLRVGIKVVDEWQISLDYVRGSNIYVRGYLDLRAWSLRLRA